VTPKAHRAPVTERALMQRLNRALAKEGRLLRTQRSVDYRGRRLYRSPELGRFFVVDVNRSIVVDKKVDLEELGRELGVLNAWEDVSE